MKILIPGNDYISQVMRKYVGKQENVKQVVLIIASKAQPWKAFDTLSPYLSSINKDQVHVVFCSSAEVYGIGPLHRLHGQLIESDSCNPISEFGDACLATELLIRSQLPAASYTIFRLFEVAGAVQSFGPGKGDDGLIGRLLLSKRLLVPPPQVKRDYIHLEDVVEALWKGIFYQPPGVFNLGSNIPVSIDDLMTLAALYKTGEKVRVELGDFPKDESIERVNGSYDFTNETGWRARRTLRDIFDSQYKYYKERGWIK